LDGVNVCFISVRILRVISF